jgi:hypothetical protein
LEDLIFSMIKYVKIWIPGAGCGDGAVEHAEEPDDQPNHRLGIKAGVLCTRIHAEKMTNQTIKTVVLTNKYRH